MNTTQLKHFLELSRTLNFSTAAQQLYITQPTLSRSILALEDEIGAKLFHRGSGNVSLTPAGQLFLQDLEPLAMRYDGLLQRVRNLGTGLAGELHIALSDEQQMPDVLLRGVKRFSAAYPSVEIQFSRMNTGDLMTALREETVDLAVGLGFIGYDRVTGGKLYEHILLENEAPCLVRAAANEHGDKMTLTTRECQRILERETLIFPSPKYLGDETANPVEPLRVMLRIPDLEPKTRYVRDGAAVSLYVSAGMGITIANKSHSLAHENGVEVLEILGAEPYRKVLQFRSDCRNPVLGRFLELLKEEI